MLNCVDIYRIGRFFYKKGIPIIPALLKNIGFLIFNSVIPYTTEIGAGSRCAYGGIGVVIHPKSTIGKRVIIGQNTTIGKSLNPDDYPMIGSDVYISAGARVIGGIHVGNNVIIGANAVVNHDVPDNCIVAGVPARIVRENVPDIWVLLEDVRWDSSKTD